MNTITLFLVSLQFKTLPQRAQQRIKFNDDITIEVFLIAKLNKKFKFTENRTLKVLMLLAKIEHNIFS